MRTIIKSSNSTDNSRDANDDGSTEHDQKHSGLPGLDAPSRFQIDNTKNAPPGQQADQCDRPSGKGADNLAGLEETSGETVGFRLENLREVFGRHIRSSTFAITVIIGSIAFIGDYNNGIAFVITYLVGVGGFFTGLLLALRQSPTTTIKSMDELSAELVPQLGRIPLTIVAVAFFTFDWLARQAGQASSPDHSLIVSMLFAAITMETVLVDIAAIPWVRLFGIRGDRS